ncbi:MAG: phosphatase PAP2 family protein [Prevotella sp.]|nr:phosphatase PAP2 family protein [Prevotella sp.]
MEYSAFIDIDRYLLSCFNGSDSLFWDGVVTTLTSGYLWIPLYVSLFYLILKNNETMIQIFLTAACAILCVVFADVIADYIMKPLVGRLRPGNDPIFKYTVDVVNDLRGMDYSFFSAHAANTMSIAVFFSLLVKHRVFNIFLIVWSLINGWTRLYLGLHYPSDVACGFIWGVMVGVGVYFLYNRLFARICPKQNYVSGHYTSSGYSLPDLNLVMTVMALTYCFAIIYGMISIGNA